MWASVVVEWSFSSCGLLTLKRKLHSCGIVEHGFSCFVAYRIFLDQGSGPCFLYQLVDSCLYVNHVWMEILTKTEDVNLLLKITFRFCFPPGPIFTLRERWKRKKHVHLGISLERVTTDNLQLFLLHWGGNPEARGEGWSWGPGGPSGPLLKGWLQARARVSASPLVLLFFFFKGRNWIFMSKSQYVNIFTSQMKQSRRNPRDHRVESMSLDLEAWGSEKEGTFQDDTRI